MTVERILFAVLLGLILIGPLPWGAAPEHFAAAMAGLVLLLGASTAAAAAFGGISIPASLYKSWPVLALLAFAVGWTGVQATALPVQWVDTLSPKASAIWSALHQIQPNTSAHISVEPDRTLLRTLQGLSLVTLFALLLALANTHRRIRLLTYAIVVSGVLQALYGSVMTLTGLEWGFFAKKLSNVGVATGTFVNRNHLAGYLEMALAVGIGVLLGNRFSAPGKNWRILAVQTAALLLSAKVPLRIGLVIMAIGLVLTRSRMGNMGFASSLGIAGLVYLLLVRQSSRGVAVALWVSLVLVDMLFIGAHFGIEKVAERLQGTTATEVVNRVDLYDYLQPWIRDFRVAGSGAGTFYTAFPPYSGPEIKGVTYDYAHNDYFQFLGEFGLIGAAPLGLAAFLSMAAACRALHARHDELLRGLAFGALMGMTAIAIHSSVDFNLQIPANAQMFVSLMALAWLSLHGPSGAAHRRRQPAT